MYLVGHNEITPFYYKYTLESLTLIIMIYNPKVTINFNDKLDHNFMIAQITSATQRAAAII